MTNTVRKLCAAARAAMASALRGAGTFRILPPPLRPPPARLGGSEDDARSLGQDWRAVGQDIREAVRRLDDGPGGPTRAL